MENSATVCQSFADVLRAGRETFNALFVQARRQHPALEGDVFSEFLVHCVDPLVNAVADVRPEAVGPAVMAAYEIGLELVGQGLAGRKARQATINEGWQRLLPAAARAVAAAPDRVIGAACNALHQLASTPDARPLQWLAEMRLIAPQIGADVDTFLKIGQVAAWRAGLAHYRDSALAVAETLPEKLALLAVGASENLSWNAVRDSLRADAWFVPDSGDSGLRVTARAGAFRGFGGLFERPPMVASDGNQFFVRAGDGCWLLTADAFGATFHRATPADFEKARERPSVSPNLQIVENQRHATIAYRRDKILLPICGAVTSSGATADTLAVTTAHSHAVVFVALHEGSATVS